MGLISILISSLLFDTNKPARVVNKLFPKLSSLSQMFYLIERKNYQFIFQERKGHCGSAFIVEKDILKFLPQA